MKSRKANSVSSKSQSSTSDSHDPKQNTRDRNLAWGLLAGLAGGLIGTIVMTQFQNAWSKATEALPDPNAEEEKPGKKEEEKEDATMKAAGKIAELGGHSLSHEEKKKLGPVVHYAFGTLQGGLYGSVMEWSETPGGVLPALAFGTSLFVGADEIAVPALGLSDPPSETPLSTHLYGLVSHLVYAVSTEAARAAVRRLL